jgi:von Willebrand factor type A domain
MRSLSTVRSILQAARACAVMALVVAAESGCGSDREEPATLPPAAGDGADGAGSGGRGSGGIGSGDGEAGEPAGPSNGEMSPSPGLVGFVDDEGVQEQSCVDQFVGVTERPPVIQFVVDTSGSMNWVAGTERLPDPGERSKWEITRDALASAIANMPDAAAVGLSYYPNTSGGGAVCNRPLAAAPIARLSPEHRALIERVNGAQVAQGGTPTHAAYEFGIEQLEASMLAGSRFLVLITDGIPTFTLECEGDGQTRVDGAPLIASVDERYRGEDIKTFVIGSPGSEPAREELSKMAFVGGTGAAGCSTDTAANCHFDMTTAEDFSAALNQALGDIAEAALGCDYAVPEPPTGRSRIDLNDVSVVVESGGNPISEFQRSTSASCDSGWQYNNDQTSIVLCRATCDELTRLVNDEQDISVRVKFGCALTPT